MAEDAFKSIFDFERIEAPPVPGMPDALKEAMKALIVAGNTYSAAEREVTRLQGEYLSILKTLETLTAVKANQDATITAWCADYSNNLSGTVATLEGLRPLLRAREAARAVAVSSVGALGPYDAELVRACLAGDEAAANAAAEAALAAGRGASLYGSAKRALHLWATRAACEPRWAGRGIPLNVVAPGVVDTPAAAWILSDPSLREEGRKRVPLAGAYPGRPEQLAELLAFCVSAHSSLMTGQILFVDGGFEASQRAKAGAP